MEDAIAAPQERADGLLSDSVEGFASNLVANRLRRLVDEGLLTRDDTGPGRRATYSLT